MNWEAVAAVGEVLGSVAVFVTLGYLAIQVRHAREETRRALSQNRMAANRELIALQLDERNLAASMKAEVALQSAQLPIHAILMEQGGLTWEEAQRVFMTEVAAWNYRIHVITHIDELPEIERDLFDQAIRARFHSAIVRLIFEVHFKPGLHPVVSKYVENLLDRPPQIRQATR
jgi:hypothetical protein